MRLLIRWRTSTVRSNGPAWNARSGRGGQNRPDVVVAACDLVVELVDLLEEVQPLAPQELIVAYDVVVELVDLLGCPPSRPVLAI